MTEEQRARWLELGDERCIKGSILVGSESYLSICATITAEATARERERCARWQPIETAPVGKDVLLYCPERGLTNEERIELGWADSGRGSHHAWATHWMPLPEPPSTAAHRAGEGEGE